MERDNISGIVTIFILVVLGRFLYRLKNPESIEPVVPIPWKAHPVSKKEKLKEKLVNEAIDKKSKFYKKLESDYKKWELMADSKEKEKLWSQLIIQQEIWDKLKELRSDHPDYVEKVNLYLKK
tara:strand:+ start:207 stop:575 length:369 start_codon:yes stop_codon:yes gene_type:complete